MEKLYVGVDEYNEVRSWRLGTEEMEEENGATNRRKRKSMIGSIVGVVGAEGGFEY